MTWRQTFARLAFAAGMIAIWFFDARAFAGAGLALLLLIAAHRIVHPPQQQRGLRTRSDEQGESLF